MSDDPNMNALGLRAMNSSYHKPRMHGGRGHSGMHDKGSFELMHVLNPRKDNPNVSKYFDGNQITKQELVELKDELNSGKTIGDIFGKGGGMSADGLLGQSLHPKGLVNLSKWAGSPLTLNQAQGSQKVSVQYEGFDSDNGGGIFLGMGKRGHGGSDRANGNGRAKFKQTFDAEKAFARLDFEPGKASAA